MKLTLGIGGRLKKSFLSVITSLKNVHLRSTIPSFQYHKLAASSSDFSEKEIEKIKGVSEKELGQSMEEIDPTSLDFTAVDEPKHQPHLKNLLSSSSLLEEDWKPTSVMDEWKMPESLAPRAIMRKGLISDHRNIRLTPYLPKVWIDRAGTHMRLGYGELAVADAYKGKMLIEDLNHALKNSATVPKEGSTEGNTLTATLKLVGDRASSTLQGPLLVKSLLDGWLEQAFLMMAQGLAYITALHDAVQVLKEAKDRFPANTIFPTRLRRMQGSLALLRQNILKQDNAHKAHTNINEVVERGRVNRVMYPWIMPEEMARSMKAVKELKIKFTTISTNAFIAPTLLSDTAGYGVFARQDIRAGESIMLDKSIYTNYNDPGRYYCGACSEFLPRNAVTMTCCDVKFCSDTCKNEALTTYHKVLCGKDFSWLYQSCQDANPTFNDMIPLLMVKVLGTAVQHNTKPLKVACVGSLMADYFRKVPSYFRLYDNIIAPLKLLQTLGVDIFTDTRFDCWALQTLFMVIENNKQGSRFEKRTFSGINPLFSMFNHSCDPSAIWMTQRGGLGGPIEVIARREIKQDEEICVSYIDIEARRPERERRGRIEGADWEDM
ncbi:MAG: hypothetical protein M1827_004002 [Pycnora praestabilis]|nr:MAG: hypothetical protein M1827_004002 [Pycnora praestabilis]